MILDCLESSGRCEKSHPGFKKAFEFLRKAGTMKLADGRNEIDGDRLYAVVVKAKGKGRAAAKFETHDRYIDIQFSLGQGDDIGWAPRALCGAHSEGYDKAKDLEFYSNRPEIWIPVRAGWFAIFFPEDAHAPMGTEGLVDKVVVKVAVDWAGR